MARAFAAGSARSAGARRSRIAVERDAPTFELLKAPFGIRAAREHGDAGRGKHEHRDGAKSHRSTIAFRKRGG
jgi:hypothetical protein